MGIAEAMTFHRNRLEMSDDFTESVLADATKNPKYRTVVYWHTTWLQFTTADLGPLTQATVTSVCVQSVTMVCLQLRSILIFSRPFEQQSFCS
jgi:hypothetical protein